MNIFKYNVSEISFFKYISKVIKPVENISWDTDRDHIKVENFWRLG